MATNSRRKTPPQKRLDRASHPAAQDEKTTQNEETTQNVKQEGWTRLSRSRHAFISTNTKAEYLPFAKILREAMMRNGLSASEVARRVWGTSKDNRGYDVAKNRDRIGHYLAGTSYPEAKNLCKLALAVGLTAEDLAIERPLNLTRAREPAGDLRFELFPGGRARLQFDRVINSTLALQILTLITENEEVSPNVLAARETISITAA